MAFLSFCGLPVITDHGAQVDLIGRVHNCSHQLLPVTRCLGFSQQVFTASAMKISTCRSWLLAFVSLSALRPQLFLGVMVATDQALAVAV